jgi:PAS domain S-box-containing protein
MHISTKLWLSLSTFALGYLATVVVNSVLSLRAEERLTLSANTLFPGSLASQQALGSYSDEVQEYQDAVVLGESARFKAAAASATEVDHALRTIADLAGADAAWRDQAVALDAAHRAFAERAQEVYPAIASGAGGDELTAKAADLSRATAELRLRFETLAHRLAGELRNELDRTVDLAVRQRLISLTVFAVVASLSCALIFWVVSRWTRRLSSLVLASERLSRGDFSVTVSDASSDEVGQLSRSFATMQAAVASRDHELRQFNDNLEVTVRSRTVELTKSNENLINEIIERERAEFSLRLLDSAINQITDAVMITTPQRSGVEPEIVYLNPAFTTLTGFPADQALGKSPWLIAGELTDRALIGRLLADTSAGVPGSGQTVAYRKDGSSFPMEWQTAPIRGKDGEVANLVAIQRDISERKRAEAAIEDMHSQLLDASRHAGMAEVATGVLHNVGNVLNSVNVSANLIADMVKHSKSANLAKAVALLESHAQDLGGFLTGDERGRQLPGYLAKLAEFLAGEREAAARELRSLVANIEHIKQIVSLQQAYGKASGFLQNVKPAELVEEAVRLNAIALARHSIRIERDYADLPARALDKHKILQVLVNLLSNAKHALDLGSKPERVLVLAVAEAGDQLDFTVTDNGVGIAPEHLQRIFAHGFTTRKNGHGFGLHSCALAAKQMNGTLTVRSDGPGTGATFVLSLPARPEEPQRPAAPPPGPAAGGAA